MPARTVSIAAAGSADFSQLNSLTNLTDINRLLHETIAWERSIEADLDKQLGRRTELERDILQLNAATSEVRGARWAGVRGQSARSSSWNLTCSERHTKDCHKEDHCHRTGQ